jgi:hypothetical protein
VNLLLESLAKRIRESSLDRLVAHIALSDNSLHEPEVPTCRVALDEIPAHVGEVRAKARAVRTTEDCCHASAPTEHVRTATGDPQFQGLSNRRSWKDNAADLIELAESDSGRQG